MNLLSRENKLSCSPQKEDLFSQLYKINEMCLGITFSSRRVMTEAQNSRTSSNEMLFFLIPFVLRKNKIYIIWDHKMRALIIIIT